MCFVFAERRLFRLGVLTLALLCIIQATLNLSLRLACKFCHKKSNLARIQDIITALRVVPKKKKRKTILQQSSTQFSVFVSVHSKADVDPFAFKGSVVGFCQNEQLQQNSTQLSFCCNNLLRLQRENQELKRERDCLWEKIQELERDIDIDNSGAGSCT